MACSRRHHFSFYIWRILPKTSSSEPSKLFIRSWNVLPQKRCIYPSCACDITWNSRLPNNNLFNINTWFHKFLNWCICIQPSGVYKNILISIILWCALIVVLYVVEIQGFINLCVYSKIAAVFIVALVKVACKGRVDNGVVWNQFSKMSMEINQPFLATPVLKSICVLPADITTI